MKYTVSAFFIASIVCGVSVAGEKTPLPESARMMSADEVLQMAQENTASGNSSYGRFAIYFNSKGRLVINKPDSGNSDTGKWYINKAGALCTKFDHWAKGKEKCRTFYDVGEEYWGYEPNGKVHKYQTIEKGNTTGKST